MGKIDRIKKLIATERPLPPVPDRLVMLEETVARLSIEVRKISNVVFQSRNGYKPK